MLPAAASRVRDRKSNAVRSNHTGIANLAAGLRIEGRAIKHHVTRFRSSQALRWHRAHPFGCATVVLPQSEDRLNVRLDLQRLVALELHLGVDLHALFGTRIESARLLRPLPLFLHGGFETLHVDVESALARDVGGQVRRKTESVVEFEHDLAGDRRAPGIGTAESRNLPVEQGHAPVERSREALFLGEEYRFDTVPALLDLRIRLAHFIHQGRHEPMEERLMQVQLVSVPQRTADDPPQDVVPILVAGHHAFRNQKGRRADVVGDDAQGRVGQHFGLVIEPGHAPRREDDLAEYVVLIV